MEPVQEVGRSSVVSLRASLRKLGAKSSAVLASALRGHVLAMAAAMLLGAAVQARGPMDNLGTVALAALPAEAHTTHRLILVGGPFPFRKDGSAFGNRERLLPRRERGFYREYTVPTPGSRDRGARRIVCGGQRPTVPEACFYTADHYASFKLIAS